METYQPIPGHSLYEASDQGQIRRGEKILTPRLVTYSRDYHAVHLGGVQTYVHRAVYAAFHGSIPTGYHIHHLNGDPADNRLKNLKALTPWEHIQHTRIPEWCETQTRIPTFI